MFFSEYINYFLNPFPTVWKLKIDKINIYKVWAIIERSHWNLIWTQLFIFYFNTLSLNHFHKGKHYINIVTGNFMEIIHFYLWINYISNDCFRDALATLIIKFATLLQYVLILNLIYLYVNFPYSYYITPIFNTFSS